VGLVLQVNINLASNAIGKNDRAPFRTFSLVGPKFDLASGFAVLGGNVANRQRSDFADTKSGIDRQDEGQSVTVSMSGGLDDTEDSPNLVVGQDRSLSHDDALS
jgi:hypothetical protein